MPDDQQTCGKGIAAHSPLPAAMAEVMAAVAENLELHIAALDLEDPATKEEQKAYRKLVKRHHKAATRLEQLAERMAGYSDLPMGRHDEQAMSRPEARAALEKLVTAERELLAVLQERVGELEGMLGAGDDVSSEPTGEAAEQGATRAFGE